MRPAGGLTKTAVNATGQDDEEESADAGLVTLLARQPIFDTDLEVVAYELLYRSRGATQARFDDPVLATAQVLVGATLDIGLARLVGSCPAYINFPPELLLSRDLPPLSPERVVVEVLEGSVPDDRLMESLGRLRALGHLVALDDFDVRTADLRLLEQADIVKIDVQQHSRAELEMAVQRLRRYPVRLVAEKIETREELELCRSLGFDLFQGYFLQKPELMRARRASCPRLSVLELVIQMSEPEVLAEELERTICRDVGLSYRILRCINSSYFGIRREVASIRQAVVLLGLGELQKLCWLLLMAGLDRQPSYVCVQSLQRARMCESLSNRAGMASGELYFMVGMLSTLDVLLQQNMEEAIAALPVTGEVRRALLAREGDLGAALCCAEAFERCAWDQAQFLDLPAEQIVGAYVDAAEWADSTWATFLRSE